MFKRVVWLKHWNGIGVHIFPQDSNHKLINRLWIATKTSCDNGLGAQEEPSYDSLSPLWTPILTLYMLNHFGIAYYGPIYKICMCCTPTFSTFYTFHYKQRSYFARFLYLIAFLFLWKHQWAWDEYASPPTNETFTYLDLMTFGHKKSKAVFFGGM